jgi:aryl-alcohol dehydrogenase-like predicted oxidoreductase
METRKLGRFEVSVVGLGCNNFGMRCDENQTAEVVSAALDSGINFFDTADIYGVGMSEQFLGKALGPRRADIVLATKFGAPMTDDPELRGGKPRWVAQAIEASLSRLGTDHVDLYQMHFPDADTPIEDTLEALNRLVEQGKVLEIGSSNYAGEQIDAAMKVSSSRGFASFISAQNHYNLLNREPEPDVVDACRRHGLALIPYFPLASGLLTGKYHRGESPPEGARLAQPGSGQASRLLSDSNFDRVEKLEKFAADQGRSILELAISWLAAQPTVSSVISGATKPDQVKANAGAAAWKLTEDELAEIDSLLA